MAKPVNDITGDAPDGQNPYKKYVPEKEGRFKYTPPPPPKPDPRDAEIFTEEKLRRSGGKMKEPPMDIEGKKRGGSIKARRFDEGGEVADKEAGLKASNGEDVGFFKRLSMGNIDQPGSEAYERFGAGRGNASREAAAEVARESGRPATRYEKPVEAVKETPSKTSEDLEYKPPKEGNMGYMANAQNVTKPPVGLASMLPPAKDKVAAPKKDTTRGYDVSPQAETKYPGQGREATGKPTAVRDYKSEEKSQREAEEEWQRNANRNDGIEGVYPEEFLIPGGKAIKYGLNALRGGAKAAEVGSASRALAPYETPITFLGKGAAKNITPVERIGAEQAKRLTSEEAQGAATGAAPRVGGPRTAAQKDAAEFIASLKGPKTGGSSGSKGKNPFDAAKDKSPRNRSSFKEAEDYNIDFKRGGNVKRYASGGSVSASSRGDGCAQRGKTRGTMR